MIITVTPLKVFNVLLITIGILTVLNISGILFTQMTDLPKVNKYIVRLIDFDKEANIPTFYATFILLFSALILGYITAIRKNTNKDYKQWLGLCLMFAFLGIDEFVSFHELLSGPIRTLLDLDGVLYLAWVVPYGVLAIAICLFYIKFLLRLLYPVRTMFLISGSLYVTGAIGCELLGSNLYSVDDTGSLQYALLYTAEEFLEMTGIVIFIYSLLYYIQTELTSFQVTLDVAHPSLISDKRSLSEGTGYDVAKPLKKA